MFYIELLCFQDYSQKEVTISIQIEIDHFESLIDNLSLQNVFTLAKTGFIYFDAKTLLKKILSTKFS